MTSGVALKISPPCFCKTRCLIGLELVGKAKVATWKAPRILWDYKNNPTVAHSLLHGFWRLNPGPQASTVSSLRLSRLPSGLPWLKVFASSSFLPVSVPERLFSSAQVPWLVKCITVLTGTGGLDRYSIAQRFHHHPQCTQKLRAHTHQTRV